jgi:acyl-CoA synthetase (AMP-forming)/AMP-acid ligase II
MSDVLMRELDDGVLVLTLNRPEQLPPKRTHRMVLRNPPDFRDDLPRTDAGKLYKRRLRDEYWRDTGRAV